jgi:hypothetical protein
VTQAVERQPLIDRRPVHAVVVSPACRRCPHTALEPGTALLSTAQGGEDELPPMRAQVGGKP